MRDNERRECWENMWRMYSTFTTITTSSHRTLIRTLLWGLDMHPFASACMCEVRIFFPSFPTYVLGGVVSCQGVSYRLQGLSRNTTGCCGDCQGAVARAVMSCGTFAWCGGYTRSVLLLLFEGVGIGCISGKSLWVLCTVFLCFASHGESRDDE